MQTKTEVLVGLPSGEALAGTAYFTVAGSNLSTQFTYDAAYLARPDSFQISPDLPLSSGGGHTQGLPAAFRDSCPDRWGCRLIEKDLANKGIIRSVGWLDYLVDVSDATREGALRFVVNGRFVGADTHIPPVVDLPRLIDASRHALTEKETHEELKLLLDAGSNSLGGARPKAAVVDGNQILMAKFSRESDRWDVMGLEKTLIDLQGQCGIKTPKAKLVRFGDASALLLERFDRKGSLLRGPRHPYLSATSALLLRDDQGATYVDLLDKAEELCGSNAVEALLRRICFSIVFNNTDDHLRNHGFLRIDGRWSLAPSFDVNPDFGAGARQTPLGTKGETDASKFMELCSLFGVASSAAQSIVKDVLGAESMLVMTAKKNRVAEHDVNACKKVTSGKASTFAV